MKRPDEDAEDKQTKRRRLVAISRRAKRMMCIFELSSVASDVCRRYHQGRAASEFIGSTAWRGHVDTPHAEENDPHESWDFIGGDNEEASLTRQWLSKQDRPKWYIFVKDQGTQESF